MLLNFIKADFREKEILDKYFELISDGVKPSEILVLAQNSNSKKRLLNKILENIPINSIEKINVHSFFSLVYNTLQDNWCFLENSIKGEKSFILPNLVGLEVSQFLLKDLLKNILVKGYNSKKSLLHQIFRRYSLIVQNDLSNGDVKERAKILKESFAEDAELIIKKLLKVTLENRSLDYLRQTLVFNFVYKHTDYFKNIKYLLVDDADEMTPVCFDFIEYLKPQLKDWVICFDSLGSSRCGYLSADTSIEYKLKKLFGEEVIDNGEKFKNGEIIFSNILENKQEPLERFSLISLSKRAEILDYAISKTKELLSQNNIYPKDITIITPLQDDMLRFTLEENLSKTCNLVFLSGSEKLISNPIVRASLNILKLMLNIEVTEMDLRSIVSDYIGIPLIYSKEIFETYEKTKTLPTKIENNYNDKYQNFYKAFCEIKEKDCKLSLKVFEMFSRVVKFVDKTKINKFNFFIKELRDFENVLGKRVNDNIEDIIIQFENSIIAENPNSTLEILENDLIIATPQKIIDNKISTKYQFWLDVSHSDWVKTDTGPLYNAWVMQKDWTKDEYTVEDDIFLSGQKTARILRKLLLLSDVHTYALSSLFDPSGVENLGGIQPYIETSTGEAYMLKACSNNCTED